MPSSAPTDEELADQAIDWLEDMGMALLPWQAEALRAILVQPTKSVFMVPLSRSGFNGDHLTSRDADDVVHSAIKVFDQAANDWAWRQTCSSPDTCSTHQGMKVVDGKWVPIPPGEPGHVHVNCCK